MSKHDHLEDAKKAEADAANRDPITGEPGSHPVGTTVGATLAGAAGTIVGAGLGGPLGAVVGASLGVAAGAAMGHNAAEAANPTYVEVEPRLQSEFATRPYANGRVYDDYREAYMFGANERHHWPAPATWDAATEATLADRWAQTDTRRSLRWDEARDAVRDAWTATDQRGLSDLERDDLNRTRPTGL